MAKRTYSVSTEGSNFMSAVIAALLSLFMLIIPFYRGLFFRENYIPAIITISILFAVFLIGKLKDSTYRVLDTYMDLTVLLIPAAYLISFFFAVNAKDAFDMLLLYFSYFIMYKLASSLSSENEKYKNLLVNVIIISTFILSFTSMLHIAGIIDIKGAFMGKRLYGLYQYPNTSASVLGVGIVLTLNRLINHEDKLFVSLYQMILTALISSFIFTISRGGYLVLAGVLLVNFLLISVRAKLKLILSIFVSFLTSSVLIYKFYTLIKEDMSSVLIYYLISIIASALIMYAAYSYKKLVKFNFSEKVISTTLIILTAILLGSAVLIFSAKEPIEYKIQHLASEERSRKNNGIHLYGLDQDSKYTVEFDVMASKESPNSYGINIRSYDSEGKYTELLESFEPTGSEFEKKSFEFTTLEDTDRILIRLYNYESDSYTIYKNVIIKDSAGAIVKRMEKFKYIPSAIADRLTDISVETKNVSTRIYFAKDGIKIIKDYPLAGAGGGAWKSLYRQYQSIPYNTTEVHNFYVQYGTEVGIIGLAILAVLLVLLFLSMVKSFKEGSSYLYIYLAVLLLLLHSVIDFNLSLAAVGYILWLLIGIISSGKKTPVLKIRTSKYMSLLVLTLTSIVFLTTSSMYYGIKLGLQGAASAIEKKDINKAIELYEKAASLDRFNSSYRYDLAQIMNNQLRRTGDLKYMEGFQQQITLIRKYEPFNHKYTPVICNMYLAIGKFEEAAALADTRLKDEPLLEQAYTLKIDVNYEIASYYLKDNKVTEAIPYLEKVVDVKTKLDELNKSLNNPIELSGNYPKKLEAAAKTLDMIKADLKK